VLDQLVHQVDRNRPVRLEALDRVLPRSQRVDLGPQRGDLLDLLVELRVLGPDEVVARALRVDPLVDAERDDDCGRRRADAPSLLVATGLAMRRFDA
jgi:hypothetical protein